jgi:hypothetical protein
LPLHQRGVGRPGVEPGSPAYKTGSLTGEIAPSWPPRSRTAHNPLIRRAPSTRWAVASGGRSNRSPAPMRPFAFQTTPAPWPVHPPWRRAENSNPTACTALSLAARPGPLAGSLSIEARDGVEPSIDNGFAGRHPPGENRAIVPQEGVEPSRPETHGSEPCAAAITPPGHGVTGRD